MIASRLDLFSADCGLVSPLELELRGPGQGSRRLTFEQPYVLVGSDPRATLRLDHPDVSWRHAYLQAYGGRLFVTNLEPGGVTLGGVPVSGGWVEPGRRMGLGPYVLSHIAPAAEPPGFPGPPLDLVEDLPPLSGPMRLAAFDVYQGAQHLSRWRMPRLLVFVGSSPRCRVRLRDPSVSRLHLVLVASAGGVWVVDLLSRTGTRVNGQVVSSARLEHEDVLEVGPYRLRADFQRRPGVFHPPVGASLPGPAHLPVVGSPPTLIVQKDRGGGEHEPLVPLLHEFNSLQQHMFDKFQQTMILLVQMLSSMHQEQVSLIREELRQFQKATDEINRLQQKAQALPTPPTRAEARPPEPPSRWQTGAWPGAKSSQEAPAAVPAPPPATASQEAAGEDAVHSWLNQRIAELQEERQSRWQRLLGFIRRS